jgi:hypothetical protein
VAIDGISRKRPAALGGEHKGRIGKLAAQLAQRADLIAAERVR